MTPEALQDKLNTLKANREKFVQEVNAQMAYLNGQIALLEELLTPEKEVKNDN